MPRELAFIDRKGRKFYVGDRVTWIQEVYQMAVDGFGRDLEMSGKERAEFNKIPPDIREHQGVIAFEPSLACYMAFEGAARHPLLGLKDLRRAPKKKPAPTGG